MHSCCAYASPASGACWSAPQVIPAGHRTAGHFHPTSTRMCPRQPENPPKRLLPYRGGLLAGWCSPGHTACSRMPSGWSADSLGSCAVWMASWCTLHGRPKTHQSACLIAPINAYTSLYIRNLLTSTPKNLLYIARLCVIPSSAQILQTEIFT